jgi:SAM-dependent methyltransferase
LKRTPTGDACPACGSRQFRPLFEATDRLYGTTAKVFQVVECSGCGLMRLYPWPEPEELRQYYPANYWFAAEPSTAASLEETYRRFVLRDHLRFVLSALQRVPRGPVLDVGCGGALFGRLLRESGHPCVGLDFSHQAAHVGWSINNVPVVVGDFSDAPFAPATFAGITMFHVLEHLYEPAAYLEAAARYLRPDGVLVVQVPNAACWQFLLFGEAWNGMDVPRHLVDFRVRDLDALLAHCGFEVLRHKHFSLRDNPAGMATSIAPSLDPMARRVRGVQEGGRQRLLKDMAYLGLVAASVPVTLLEAACRAGSTIMVEARRKAA